MIYDLLLEYRDYLMKSYSSATAETYYKRLCRLFEGQHAADTVKRLDVDLVLEKLANIRHKNYFSQAKNAFRHFCEFKDIKLSAGALENIQALGEKTKKKYRKLKAVDYNQVDSKIKHIRNNKLKLGFQAIVATGLRVSELAQLAPDDCTITADAITFKFTGKGRQDGVVVIQESECPKLYNRLKDLIESTPVDKKVFYSAGYLQSKAKELGFACHDLRRAFAKLEYQKCRSKTAVMRKMRHSSVKNTNIYLKSKVNI